MFSMLFSRTACQLEEFTVTGFLIDQYDVRSLVGYNDFWGSIWEFEISDICNNAFAILRLPRVHLLHDMQ